MRVTTFIVRSRNMRRFSQSVIDLTKIVSDGMASVNKSSGV